jgi:diguanylate cyclase (GGDEF)-like protein
MHLSYLIICGAIFAAFIAMSAGVLKAFGGGAYRAPAVTALWLTALHIAVYAVFLYTPNPGVTIFLHFLLPILKILTLTVLLLFAVKYTSPFYKFRRSVLCSLFAVPAVSFMLLLSNYWHGLVYQADARVLQYVPLKEVAAQNGLWMYVVFLYTYLLLLAGVYIYAVHYKTVPVLYRFKGAALIFAHVLYTLFDILEALGVHNGFSATVVGAFVAVALGYWALVVYRGSDLVVLSRDAVFEKISCVALILEHDGKIIDANPCARATFAGVAQPPEGQYYGALLEAWLQAGQGAMEHTPEGLLLSVNGEDGTLYYQVTESEITNNSGEHIGDFVEIRDITAQRQLYLDMFRAANYDQLTNLFNRRYYDILCEKYDRPKYHPLAFISGDLNGLKWTNDSFGHLYGDRLLMNAAKILTEAAPDRAAIARVGGDEFIVLIPNCQEAEAAAYMDRVSALCKERGEEPYGEPSVALGAYMKRDQRETVHEAMLNADLLMYEQKRHYKRGRKEWR